MITREEAFNLLKKYNKDPFHIQHSLTVEAMAASEDTINAEMAAEEQNK